MVEDSCLMAQGSPAGAPGPPPGVVGGGGGVCIYTPLMVFKNLATFHEVSDCFIGKFIIGSSIV